MFDFRFPMFDFRFQSLDRRDSLLHSLCRDTSRINRIGHNFGSVRGPEGGCNFRDCKRGTTHHLGCWLWYILKSIRSTFVIVIRFWTFNVCRGYGALYGFGREIGKRTPGVIGYIMGHPIHRQRRMVWRTSLISMWFGMYFGFRFLSTMIIWRR